MENLMKISTDLTRQCQFTKDILASMRDMVRVIDKNEKIIFINEPMEKMFGNIIGTRCYEVLGRSRKCEICISDTTIKKGITMEKEEIIGDKIYSVISSPIRDENGEIYCAVEVFRDVTEKRKLEKTIVEQNLKMKKDLNFAKYIQERILPMDGMYGDAIKIESKYIPCEMLGGDIYDIVEIDENNIGLYMADVSGHGVTASMMTMFIKQALKNLGSRAISPKFTLDYLNKMYNDLNLDDYHYITIIYGVLNKQTREITLVNGGYNSMPLVLRSNKVEEIYLPGLPISTLNYDMKYTYKSIKLVPRDRLLFYTDGVKEAKNDARELYGNRILDVCQNGLNKCSKKIIENIMDDVNLFSNNNIDDDVAIMVVEIL